MKYQEVPVGATREKRRKDFRFLVWLTILSILIHTCIVLGTRHGESVDTLDGDEQEYWTLATDFEKSGLAGISARRTVIFPFLIAELRHVTGDDYLFVQLALSTLLSISAAIAFLVVRRHVAGGLTARVAAVGVLLWPSYLRFDSTLYCDSFALLIFLCFLAAIPAAAEEGRSAGSRPLQFLIAGAILGLCVQTKPLYLIYIPIALGILLIRRTTWSRRTIAATCLALGCAAAMTPWSAYLSEREGTFIAVSANGGETLAGGLNPKLMQMKDSNMAVTADGRVTWNGPGKWLAEGETGYLSARDEELPYLEKSKLLTERSMRWIVSHPLAVAYLSARKLLYMWGVYPFWNGLSQTVLGNLPLLALVIAACFGFSRTPRPAVDLAMFWTLPLFVSAVALISWGSWRFRESGDFGLIVLASLLVETWGWASRPR